jgi:hypothetical protein
MAAVELGLPPGFHFVPTDEEVPRWSSFTYSLASYTFLNRQPRNNIMVSGMLSSPREAWTKA